MSFGKEFPLFQRWDTHRVISVFSNLFSAAEYLPTPIKLMMLHSVLTLICDHQATSPLPFHACTGFGKTPSIPRFLDIHSTKNH